VPLVMGGSLIIGLTIWTIRRRRSGSAVEPANRPARNG